MHFIKYLEIIFLICICLLVSFSWSNDDLSELKDTNIINNKDPIIMISILIRNKEYSLPYFLYYLENLDYAKNKIMLWLVI